MSPTLYQNCIKNKATHASSNTLPGLKSLFERKLEERKHFDASHIRGSPEIGNIFINYPGAGGSDRKMLKTQQTIRSFVECTRSSAGSFSESVTIDKSDKGSMGTPIIMNITNVFLFIIEIE